MRVSKLTLALLAALACLGLSSVVAQADTEPLGIENFEAGGRNADGTDSTEAGGHSFEVLNKFNLKTAVNKYGGEPVPTQNVKTLNFELPPGYVGNLADYPQCPQIRMDELGNCPVRSQIGTATLKLQFIGLAEPTVPIYNLEPPDGMAAQFGLIVISAVSHINFTVRGGSDYGVNVTLTNINHSAVLYNSSVSIWGVPADPGHDKERFLPRAVEFTNMPYPNGREEEARENGEELEEDEESEEPRFPVLSNPTSCNGPSVTTMTATTWQFPSLLVAPPAAVSEGMEGCNALEFDPSIKAKPTTNAADTPSGFEFHLHIPQNADAFGTTAAHLRDAVVDFPPGYTINPSSANGLDACTPAQIGMLTAVGDEEAEFTDEPENCPPASRLGSVKIETPLVDHPLEGSIYLASQNQNPFGSTIAIYITSYDPKTGVVLKLPSNVEADPTTGELTATVKNGPQLPFEDLDLEFFRGANAPLKTPVACGKYDIKTVMTPWSFPEGATTHPADSFEIEQGAGGAPCVSSEGAEPNSPRFEAGTVDSTAGAYSPFILKLSRADGTQQLTGINTNLPKGLIAKLAGAASCSNAALATAATRSGRDELAGPSCPAASKVGTVTVGAGAGPTPYFTTGSAYLAGPYKGAPVSLAVITPAVAGPFDLGNVVVRNALYIDPVTAAVRTVSDPFPSILKGIPLDLRSIALSLDRSQFTKNPTSCAPAQIGGLATSLVGQNASLASHFQVGECEALPFKPTLKLSLKGSTSRRAHPSLQADLTARPGDANIAGAQVKLPNAAFLDNAHIKTVCTRVDFAAHNCPAGSIYGKATATTPLLGYTLAGPVYLRANPEHELPDLVAALQGPSSQPIEVALAGTTDSVKGALRNTFEAVPDVPVSKFSLTLFGGKKGLIVMSDGFCARPNASIKFDAQNGKSYDTTPKVAGKCEKKGKKKHKSGRVKH